MGFCLWLYIACVPTQKVNKLPIPPTMKEMMAIIGEIRKADWTRPSIRLKTIREPVGNYTHFKRRGIGQYPIFSRTPYFYAKKHTTFVIKVEVLGKRLFSLLSMQPIKSTNPKKLRIQTWSRTHTNRTYQSCHLWIRHLAMPGFQTVSVECGISKIANYNSSLIRYILDAVHS